MILYVNSCVREDSRTDYLARKLLAKLNGDVTEINLETAGFEPLNKKSLEERTRLINQNDYSHKMFAPAKLFASADKIVISAPFWDYSFPSSLKVFIENIYVTGITTELGAHGIPHGLCKADELYYVTTAGGAFIPDFSFDYIKATASAFGIKNVKLIKAEMLDVHHCDSEKILMQAIRDYGLE